MAKAAKKKKRVVKKKKIAKKAATKTLGFVAQLPGTTLIEALAEAQLGAGRRALNLKVADAKTLMTGARGKAKLFEVVLVPKGHVTSKQVAVRGL